jgi:hypothetical protein
VLQQTSAEPTEHAEQDTGADLRIPMQVAHFQTA